jgi:hypothetical protein
LIREETEMEIELVSLIRQSSLFQLDYVRSGAGRVLKRGQEPSQIFRIRFHSMSSRQLLIEIRVFALDSGAYLREVMLRKTEVLADRLLDYIGTPPSRDS